MIKVHKFRKQPNSALYSRLENLGYDVAEDGEGKVILYRGSEVGGINRRPDNKLFLEFPDTINPHYILVMHAAENYVRR